MSLTLNDPSLLRQQGFIDGHWTQADGGARFAVHDPATGRVLAEVADMGVAQTRLAIEGAARALPGWRARTAKDRAAVLRRWYELILAHADDLAAIMTKRASEPTVKSFQAMRLIDASWS
jgi:succinate-semialdehyde dehydrogenase/glutarate-semialdehyde dehydrogenase